MINHKLDFLRGGGDSRQSELPTSWPLLVPVARLHFLIQPGSLLFLQGGVITKLRDMFLQSSQEDQEQLKTASNSSTLHILNSNYHDTQKILNLYTTNIRKF